MTTISEMARGQMYQRRFPDVMAEARARFTPQTDYGAVVKYADYLLMPPEDRAVADFWSEWLEFHQSN